MNLKVHFTINDVAMGSTMVAQADTPLAIVVRLEDPDEPTASYRVSLRHDEPGGIVEATSDFSQDNQVGDGEVRFDQFKHTIDGEYWCPLTVSFGSTS
jgi:hypothetical protein